MKTTQERRAAFKRAFNDALELASKCDWKEPGITVLLAGKSVRNTLDLFDAESTATAKEAIDESRDYRRQKEQVEVALTLLHHNPEGYTQGVRDRAVKTLYDYLKADKENPDETT